MSRASTARQNIGSSRESSGRPSASTLNCAVFTLKEKMANGGKPNRPLRPRGGGGPAGRRRRVVIDQGAQRPSAREQRQARQDGQAREPKQPAAPQTGPVAVESGISVQNLSQALGVSMPQLIKILM